MSAPNAEAMPEPVTTTVTGKSTLSKLIKTLLDNEVTAATTRLSTPPEELERPNFLGDHASFLLCPDYH